MYTIVKVGVWSVVMVNRVVSCYGQTDINRLTVSAGLQDRQHRLSAKAHATPSLFGDIQGRIDVEYGLDITL